MSLAEPVETLCLRCNTCRDLIDDDMVGASHRSNTCRDLVDEDIDGGRSAPLPRLSDEEWHLLLDAPPFQMATCMRFTRTRRTSSRKSSSRSSAAAAAAADSEDSEASELGGDDDEGSGEAGDAAADGEGLQSMGSLEAATERDARSGLHFLAESSRAVEPMAEAYRAEVCRLCCLQRKDMITRHQYTLHGGVPLVLARRPGAAVAGPGGCCAFSQKVVAL